MTCLTGEIWLSGVLQWLTDATGDTHVCLSVLVVLQSSNSSSSKDMVRADKIKHIKIIKKTVLKIYLVNTDNVFILQILPSCGSHRSWTNTMLHQYWTFKANINSHATSCVRLCLATEVL